MAERAARRVSLRASQRALRVVGPGRPNRRERARELGGDSEFPAKRDRHAGRVRLVERLVRAAVRGVVHERFGYVFSRRTTFHVSQPPAPPRGGARPRRGEPRAGRRARVRGERVSRVRDRQDVHGGCGAAAVFLFLFRSSRSVRIDFCFVSERRRSARVRASRRRFPRFPRLPEDAREDGFDDRRRDRLNDRRGSGGHRPHD